ncbi:MAG: DNA-3-methyladenine glycosylase [Nitrososphaerota archaeon]|nr:DNA-3-methyladenine glycosylase [Nitrososphaerota archaeon]
MAYFEWSWRSAKSRIAGAALTWLINGRRGRATKLASDGGAGGRLSRRFFERYTPDVARDLVGCRLVRVLEGRRLSGTIVETEAYRGARDPASHAYRGRTPRNGVMFGPAGHAYVYFTMGMHYCLNATTEPEGTPAAVLLRAVEPLEGVGAMAVNRGVSDLRRLAAGPGNLTKALAVDGALNGEDMVKSGRLFFEERTSSGPVGASARVGVSAGQNRRWRFYLDGSPFVSRGKPSLPQNP